MKESKKLYTSKKTDTKLYALHMILSVVLCLIVSSFASCSNDTSEEAGKKDLTHEDSLALGLIHDNPSDTTVTKPDKPSKPLNEIEVKIDGLIYILNEDEHTAKVYRKDSDALVSIVIPETVHYNNNNYPVVAIGSGAFYYETKIEQVRIKGNNLKSIESMAFAKCFRLNKINLPNSLTEIGAYAFHNSGLESIKFPTHLTKIGKAAFRVCPLESITFPNELDTIGEEAFYECRHLKDITIPNVKNIEANAFQNCDGLKSVKILAKLEDIKERAFGNCTNLREIWIPKSLQAIGDNAFEKCYSIENVIIEDPISWCHITFGTIDSNPLFHGSRLYDFDKKEITDITIPNDMSTVGKYVFYGCESLKKVIIPENISSIGYAAFEECKGMKVLSLSKNVSKIEDEAFHNCYISDIYCYATKVPDAGADSFSGGQGEATLHIPSLSMSLYKTKSPWKYFGKFVAL